MMRTMTIYFGIIMTVILSSVGLVFVPDFQLFSLAPYKDAMGTLHPTEPWGAGYEGRKVYVDLGCVYCHSQQVRAKDFGADLNRGWGMRRSVARDYIYDRPHLLGTMRTGPDLMNIGARQPDLNWHYQHLFNPRITSPGSIMPAFPFLFELKKLKPGEMPPPSAVRVPEQMLPKGFHLMPKARALNLVAYLKSMDHNYPLPEAR